MLDQFCYGLLLVITAGLFLYKVSFKKKRRMEHLNRETTDVLKGYAIVLIVIHHMVVRMTSPGILFPFRLVGYLGVTIFFFLSGYGLVCSAKDRETVCTWGGVLRKRILKVYIPAVFAQFLYMIVLMSFFGERYTTFKFIEGLLFLYPIDTFQWYIIAAFFWYISFETVRKLCSSWEKRLIFLFGLSALYFSTCFWLGLGKNWIDTSLCFPIGATYAVYQKKCMRAINQHLFLFPATLVLFVITVLFSFRRETLIAVMLRNISTIALIVMILMLLSWIDISKNKLVACIGVNSLAIYLVHGKVIRVIERSFGNVTVKEMVIYFTVTMLLTISFALLLRGYYYLLKNNVKG